MRVVDEISAEYIISLLKENNVELRTILNKKEIVLNSTKKCFEHLSETITVTKNNKEDKWEVIYHRPYSLPPIVIIDVNFNILEIKNLIGQDNLTISLLSRRD